MKKLFYLVPFAWIFSACIEKETYTPPAPKQPMHLTALCKSVSAVVNDFQIVRMDIISEDNSFSTIDAGEVTIPVNKSAGYDYFEAGRVYRLDIAIIR